MGVKIQTKPPPMPTATYTVPPPATPSPKDRFDNALYHFVLPHECDYPNPGYDRVEHDPSDPGGTTKFGVDANGNHLSSSMVESLTLEQAVEIYRSKYWHIADGITCDDLPLGIGEVIFDTRVNGGYPEIAHVLQLHCGVKADGDIGPQTIAAAKRLSSVQWEPMALAMIDARDDRFKRISENVGHGKYLHGWLQRDADLREFIKTL